MFFGDWFVQHASCSSFYSISFSSKKWLRKRKKKKKKRARPVDLISRCAQMSFDFRLACWHNAWRRTTLRKIAASRWGKMLFRHVFWSFWCIHWKETFPSDCHISPSPFLPSFEWAKVFCSLKCCQASAPHVVSVAEDEKKIRSWWRFHQSLEIQSGELIELAQSPSTHNSPLSDWRRLVASIHRSWKGCQRCQELQRCRHRSWATY